VREENKNQRRSKNTDSEEEEEEEEDQEEEASDNSNIGGSGVSAVEYMKRLQLQEEGRQKMMRSDGDKVVKAQAFIRAWVARRKFKKIVHLYTKSKFAKPLRRRHFILNEIEKSEDVYVSGLHNLVKVYVSGLRQMERDHVIPHGTVASIFTNIEAVLAVHMMFSKELKERMSQWPNPVRVGEAFEKLVWREEEKRVG